MRVKELREILENYQEEDLRLLVSELYKMMPKKLRESQDVDVLIKNGKELLHEKKTVKVREKQADMTVLKPEIEYFIQNAYAQNYFVPNRIIPKGERPKWRFKVKGYIKNLQTVPSEGEEGKIAADLLEKLYGMLCYGCCYYIFSSCDTFRSVGIGQAELLETVLIKKFGNGINREVIKTAISLVLKQGLDREMLHSILLDVLVANLKISDSKEIAIEEAMAQKVELDRERVNVSKKKGSSSISHADFERSERINLLVELVFKLNVALCEYEVGINYFKKNCVESSKEISLYVLLRMLFEYDLKEYWITEYEKGEKAGVKPRESLQRVYQYTMTNGELPENFW